MILDPATCDACGNDPDECVCPPELPDDLITELDTDFLDWEFYEEKNDNESSRQEDPSKADYDW